MLDLTDDLTRLRSCAEADEAEFAEAVRVLYVRASQIAAHPACNLRELAVKARAFADLARLEGDDLGAGAVALARALARDVQKLAAPKVSTEIAKIDAELSRLFAAYATLAEADEEDTGAWTARLAADRQYRQLLAQLGEHPAGSPADVGVKARWLSIEQAEAGGSLCEMDEVNPLLASLLSDVRAIG